MRSLDTRKTRSKIAIIKLKLPVKAKLFARRGRKAAALPQENGRAAGKVLSRGSAVIYWRKVEGTRPFGAFILTNLSILGDLKTQPFHKGANQQLERIPWRRKQ
jgi:hypothetical protein